MSNLPFITTNVRTVPQKAVLEKQYRVLMYGGGLVPQARILNIWKYIYTAFRWNRYYLKAQIKALPDDIPLDASIGSVLGKNPLWFQEESPDKNDEI